MKKNIYIKFIFLLLGTNVVFSQVIDDIDFSVKCGTKFNNNDKDKQYDKLLYSNQCTIISKMNRFRVHYDTTGIYAVDITDKDKNGIPDYIDSVCAVFDYVYEVQVIQMGMERPRTDYPDEPNNTYYDIFITDFSITNDPIYGFAENIGKYHNTDKIYKAYSTITIDNSYSPNKTYIKDGVVKKLYNTTGINALKVTAAHEFQHAIQYATGIIKTNNNTSIYEMVAVCVEMLVYPDIYDYVYYVNGWLRNIERFVFGNGYSENGYSFGIFFYMLSEKYGKNIINDYYDVANQIGISYKGLDSILVLNNSSLHKEWMEFIEWIYYSGKNSIEGKYFPMANKFETLQPIHTLNHYGLITNDVQPYQLTYTRFINYSANSFIMSDTVELFFTNTDMQELIYGEMGNNTQTIQCNAISSQYENQDSKELFKNFWLLIYSPNESMDYYLVTKPGGEVSKITYCYPMPFNKIINDYLCIPIDDEIIIGEKVKLNIYNTSNMLVFSDTIETTIDNHHRVLKYKPDILDIGIYTFTISRGTTDLIGKIVIK